MNTQRKTIAPSIPYRFDVRILILILLLAALFPLVYDLLLTHPGDDYSAHLRPATLRMLQGSSPYDDKLSFNPPWGFLLLVPVAVLPAPISRFVFFLVSLSGFGYLAYRATKRPVAQILFLTSLPVYLCLHEGNLDWLSLLSVFVPAPFALMLAVIKPQVGAGVVIFWVFESWRRGGAKLLFWNFLPVLLLTISSFLLYGFWPANSIVLRQISWNVSPFPYLIPVGLVLLFQSIRKMNITPALAAGFMISPYITLASLSSALLNLLENPKILALASAILWLGQILIVLVR